MTLINHYMDEAQATGNIAARAKAEKYAKILAKTVVSPNGDTDYGQNAYFYDAAEGLLTSVVLLLAEFLPPDSKCPNADTSCPYSSWCRSCWHPPAFAAKTGSRF